MNGNSKIERRRPKAEAEGLLTRGGVAGVLGVSVRTVDRMKAAGEIRAVTLRGWSVRFDRAEVMEAVRKGGHKYGRKAALGENPKTDQPKSEGARLAAGNPKPETRNPKADGWEGGQGE